MAHFQSDVPKGIEHAVNEPGQVWERPARRDLAVVQEHKIDIAERIEFGAAITADGDEGKRWKFLLRLGGERAARGLPEVLEQGIQDSGAAAANLEPPRAAPMQYFEPVGLDAKERLITCKIIRESAVGRQIETRRGVGLYFSD